MIKLAWLWAHLKNVGGYAPDVYSYKRGVGGQKITFFAHFYYI